jgi:hypothetical protein
MSHAPAHHGHPTEPQDDEGPRRSWALLGVTLAAQILVVLDISVVNTALPRIGQSLHLAGGDLQWLVTAYLMMSGGGLLLGGGDVPLAGGLPRCPQLVTGPVGPCGRADLVEGGECLGHAVLVDLDEAVAECFRDLR